MKLAVLIGVSRYGSGGLSNLPGCEQDVSLINAVLSKQKDFEEILTISGEAQSHEVKRLLIEFINRYKNKPIDEFVFYYTGHGGYIDNEYYYLLTDYHEAKLRQTSLENTELDNLIRLLNPEITTKIVDSCQSGVPYIKDKGEFSSYLKGTQNLFKNCYFMFSSQTDEFSYQDKLLSDFTKALGELIVSRTGSIRHKDIIDYVSDHFSLNTLQTPFFVVQADFTDVFCEVDKEMQKEVLQIFESKKASMGITDDSDNKTRTDLKSLIETDAKFYCTKDEARAFLDTVKELTYSYKTDKESFDVFDLKWQEINNLKELSNANMIGKWFNENTHGYFAAPETELVTVRKVKAWASIARIAMIGSHSKYSDDDFEMVTEKQIKGVKSTTEMPYSHLLLKATSKYPNINSTACFIVPFVSRTHVLLFVGFDTYVSRGWGDEVLKNDLKWRTFEERMKDTDALKTTINSILTTFWEFTMTPIKKKFGLLEEAEAETINQIEAPTEKTTLPEA